MTGLPLPPPQIQFIDADGEPYAGGTVETYVPGTTTPKNCWQDEAETILNTNPIVLDAAGRAIIWGTGDYRFIVRDVTGQLVYDGVTSVVDLSGYATTADVTAAVQAETNRAEAAENTLTTNLNNEISRAEAAENTLTTNLNNEIARAEAAENNLQTQITGLHGTTPTWQSGYGTSNSSGAGTVTFTTPFSATPAVVASVVNGTNTIVVVGPSTTGFQVEITTLNETTGATSSFSWIAVGTT